MLRNNNSEMMKELAKRSFQFNLIRNIMVIMAIILTTGMFTTLYMLPLSIAESSRQAQFALFGTNAQMVFQGVTEQEAEKIISRPEVKTWGKGICGGIIDNEELIYREVGLFYGDEDFVKSNLGVPESGRMPVKEDEIALDKVTLDALGMPYKLGQKVLLEWREDTEGTVREQKEFTLVGSWKGSQGSYMGKAWVSELFIYNNMAKKHFLQNNTERSHSQQDSPGTKATDRIAGLYTVDTFIYDIKKQERIAESIITELKLPGDSCRINDMYQTNWAIQNADQAAAFALGILLVFVSGYLIIYNVFQISMAGDIRFYGKLKTLGTSSAQIRGFIYRQANRLCLIGIPIGLLLGYGGGTALAPFVIMGYNMEHLVSKNPIIFIASALFAYITVLISCYRPAVIASRISPMEALHYTEAVIKLNKRRRRIPISYEGILAFQNLGRNKRRTVTVVSSLALGFVLLCCMYARYISYNSDLYVPEKALSDFALSDSSVSSNYGRYNPQGTTITPELLNKIESLPGLTQTGRVYSNETRVSLSDRAYENNIRYFEADNKERLKYMKSDIEWTKGYYAMKKSKSAMAVVFGIDGLAVNGVDGETSLLEGTIDREKFMTGNYVIAGGYGPKEQDYKQPNYEIGDSVVIDGKTYEVMAIAESKLAMKKGNDSPEAAFSLYFYIPADTFTQLYPDNSMRLFFFDIEDTYEENAEQFLEDYQKTIDSGLPVISRKTVGEDFQIIARSSVLAGAILSVILAFIGILNFAGTMITTIVSRKRDFAVMQGIGMTKRQIKKMLVFESLSYVFLTLAAAYPLSILAVGVGMKMYLEVEWTAFTIDWASKFEFSILPLLICTPVLLILALLLPFVCFRVLEKNSVAERLHVSD